MYFSAQGYPDAEAIVTYFEPKLACAQMKPRCYLLGIAILLLLHAPGMRAQDGLRGAFSYSPGVHALPGHSLQIAAADFDNDLKPDGAVLLETGLREGKRSFRIELHLTASDDNNITFSSPEAEISISALDVNRDGAPDIIVEKAFTHQRLQVYLNDGQGVFHKARTEDYPTPDPSSPSWRSQLTGDELSFCLPASRSVDTGCLQRISILPRNFSAQLKFLPEVFLAQSAARAPTASRAPPSLLSL